MADLRIGVAGCAGRMGQTLLKQIAATPGCTIGGGTERPGHAAIGQDPAALLGLKATGARVFDDPAALFDACDAVIDFTAPEATVRHAALAAGRRKILIAGTTGLKPEQEQALRMAAVTATIVYAANMSVGVNVLLQVTKQVAALLGPDFDIEVLEMHHKHKVDAPSGTALALGRAAAAGRKVKLDEVAVRARDGITGARKAGDIGFATLRGGSVVGDHTVMFASDSERIELTHKAQDRSLFSSGAVRAALWARGKPAGLYGMNDVLGFKD